MWNRSEYAFLSLTWSVILRAFLLVKSIPGLHEIWRVAASDTVEAMSEQQKSQFTLNLKAEMQQFVKKMATYFKIVLNFFFF